MDTDSNQTYYTALTHLSPRIGAAWNPDEIHSKSEAYFRIKHLLREFNALKQELLLLKAHVGDADDDFHYLRQKFVSRTQRVRMGTTASHMSFTILRAICRKILDYGSLNGLTMAELKFLQESACAAAMKHSTNEADCMKSSCDLEICAQRIEHLHSVMSAAKESIQTLRMDFNI